MFSLLEFVRWGEKHWHMIQRKSLAHASMHPIEKHWHPQLVGCKHACTIDQRIVCDNSCCASPRGVFTAPPASMAAVTLQMDEGTTNCIGVYVRQIVLLDKQIQGQSSMPQRSTVTPISKGRLEGAFIAHIKLNRFRANIVGSCMNQMLSKACKHQRFHSALYILIFRRCFQFCVAVSTI